MCKQKLTTASVTNETKRFTKLLKYTIFDFTLNMKNTYIYVKNEN